VAMKNGVDGLGLRVLGGETLKNRSGKVRVIVNWSEGKKESLRIFQKKKGGPETNKRNGGGALAAVPEGLIVGKRGNWGGEKKKKGRSSGKKKHGALSSKAGKRGEERTPP